MGVLFGSEQPEAYPAPTDHNPCLPFTCQLMKIYATVFRARANTASTINCLLNVTCDTEIAKTIVPWVSVDMVNSQRGRVFARLIKPSKPMGRVLHTIYRYKDSPSLSASSGSFCPYNLIKPFAFFNLYKFTRFWTVMKASFKSFGTRQWPKVSHRSGNSRVVTGQAVGAALAQPNVTWA